MIVMLCVDDKYGMMFNCRRQSQDRVLRERIQKLTGGKPLWMNAYSRKQFEDSSNICVSEDYLDQAAAGEFPQILRAFEVVDTLTGRNDIQASLEPSQSSSASEAGGAGSSLQSEPAGTDALSAAEPAA